MTIKPKVYSSTVVFQSQTVILEEASAVLNKHLATQMEAVRDQIIKEMFKETPTAGESMYDAILGNEV